MNATKRNKVQSLDARQLTAVDLLVNGATDSEVAEKLTVDRSTVWRWRTNDPEFQAELARRRNELWASLADHLRAVLPTALNVVARAVDDGDHTAALALLKLAGVGDLELGRVGLTDAEEIEEAHRARERWKLQEAARAAEAAEEEEVRAAERKAQLELRRLLT